LSSRPLGDRSRQGAQRLSGRQERRCHHAWHVTPRTLTEALAAGGAEAKRAFDAMMTMQKIDVVRIDAARRG
jgi:hypothetical protein